MTFRILVGRSIVIIAPLALYYFQSGVRDIILTLALYFIFIEFMKWLQSKMPYGLVPSRYRMLNEAVLWFWDGFSWR